MRGKSARKPELDQPRRSLRKRAAPVAPAPAPAPSPPTFSSLLAQNTQTGENGCFPLLISQPSFKSQVSLGTQQVRRGRLSLALLFLTGQKRVGESKRAAPVLQLLLPSFISMLSQNTQTGEIGCFPLLLSLLISHLSFKSHVPRDTDEKGPAFPGSALSDR